MNSIYFKIYIFLDCDVSEYLLEATIDGYDDMISLNKKSGSGKDAELQQYACVYLISFDCDPGADREVAVGFESIPHRFYSPVGRFIDSFQRGLAPTVLSVSYTVDSCVQPEGAGQYTQCIESANNGARGAVLVDRVTRLMAEMGIEEGKQAAIRAAVQEQFK